MTINDFFQTLKDAGQLSGKKEEIAYDLCESSGMDFSLNTIHKWIIDEKRSPRRSKLSIDNEGFIRYFEKHTRSTWPDIQEKFSEIDKHGFINRSTKSSVIFYRSLLSLFYDVLRLVPTSLCHILPEKPLVFGREKELNLIAEIFTTSNYAIITGIGGIGKSYVASSYAHSLTAEGGWTIQHIVCEDSDNLQTAVNKLQFDNLPPNKKTEQKNDKENFNHIITKLKKCFTPTLVILDNLNRPFTWKERKDFEELKNCGQHIHFLITSRNTLHQDKQNIVNILPLDDDSLLMLYKYHRFSDFSDHKNYFDSRKNILNQLFSLIEKHTLMITLLAKLPERCSLTEDRIYELISDNLSLPSESVHITKDGVLIENAINVILERIFDISQLSDIEKSIMCYMSLMPLAGVDTDLFEELTHHSKDDIRSLVNNCWIIRNEETFVLRLHPLIYNTIHSLDDSRLSKELCFEFCKHVATIRDRFPEDSYEWNIHNKIVASSLSVFYNINIKHNLNDFFDFCKNNFKYEIRNKLKFNPKIDSKNELINKLIQSTPEDEFSAKIINTLIAKLKAISENELTDFSLDKLIDDSVNECATVISYVNKFLTNYSEGKY